MSASIERFISWRLGGVVLLSVAETGPLPSGAFSYAIAWRMIATDWRISSMRMR